MVRWKKSRRANIRQAVPLEEVAEESLEEVDDVEEDEDGFNPNSGEHEDNDRDPMIRMIYFPLVILAIVFSSTLTVFSFAIEYTVYTNNEKRKKHMEQLNLQDLRTPPMDEILEDRCRFKQEKEFLRTCNLQLTNTTWFNVILEFIAFAYSFLLLTVNANYIYPTAQLVLYIFLRITYGSSKVYSRFYGPEDVIGAVLAEVLYEFITNHLGFAKNMRGTNRRNSIKLSFLLLRHGISAFQELTTQEITKCLNQVGHLCLNIFATTAVLISILSYFSCNPENKNCDASFLLLSLAMWLQLAAARHRTIIPLIFSAMIEAVIFVFISLGLVNMFSSDKTLQIKDCFAVGFWALLISVRLLFTLVLYKVLSVENPQFSLSTTVFLKPTNTPVTFSSVLAPQELDPTNPYYPQTVYNHIQSNPLNKTVA
ncbi:unnamed protein product [Caenorhabditis sp. 36 PRJEB53466]|nr:unnamed protein product [Caenorhabditis sp. 36 PRJEB53466]